MAKISSTSRVAAPAASAAIGEERPPLADVVVLAGGQAQRLELEVARQIPLLRRALALPSGGGPLPTAFSGEGLAHLRRHLGGGGGASLLPPPADVAGRAALAEAARLGGLDALFFELEVYEPQRAAALRAQQAGDAPAAAGLLRALATQMLGDVLVDDDGQRRPANAEAAARRELVRAAELAPAPSAEVPYFRAWCGRAPLSPAAWEGLAEALAAAFEHRAAAIAARRSMALAIDEDGHRRARGIALKALAAAQRWSEVAALVAEASAGGRDDDGLYRAVAALYDDADRHLEALGALDVLRARDVLTGADMLLRGDVLWSLDDVAAGLACYRAALAADPPVEAGALEWTELGDLFFDRLDNASAVVAYGRALALPDGRCANTFAARGWAHWHEGALPAAIRDAAAALNHDPDNVAALRLRVRTAPGADEAAEALRHLVAGAEATADEWYALAQMEQAQGDLAGALVAVNMALKGAPAHAQGWMLLLRGAVLQRLHGAKAPGDDLRQAAFLLHNDPEGLVELYNCHIEGQRWEAAASALRRAMALAPERLDIKLSLASVLCRSGHLEAAAEMLERLRLAHPNDARVLDWLALAREGQGLDAAATQAARAAEQVAPEDPEMAENLGALLARRRLWVEADAAYGRALAAGSLTAAAARARLFGGRHGARLVAEQRVLALMRRPEVVDVAPHHSADRTRVLFGRAQLPWRPRASIVGRLGRAYGEILRAHPGRGAAYAGLLAGLSRVGLGAAVEPLWNLLGLALPEGAVPELSALDAVRLAQRRSMEEETARLWVWLTQCLGRVAGATDAELRRMAATVAALEDEMDWFAQGTRARADDLAWAVAQAQAQRQQGAAADVPGA